MSQWFRMYTEVLDDPKVQRMSGETFKQWVNLLCLAARHDGQLPPLSDIAFALRVRQDKAKSILQNLKERNLLDDDGTPHNWRSRQFKSDVSTERVKRFRGRSKPVTETPPETEADTEQIAETSSEVSSAASAQPPPIPEFLQRKDLKSEIFGSCLRWLAEHSGRPTDSLRSVVGKWCRDYGDGRVLEAMQYAARDGPVEPVAWIERKLRGGGQKRPSLVDAAELAMDMARKLDDGDTRGMHSGADAAESGDGLARVGNG